MKHEKYSWILYLNDSDGDTIFFEGKIKLPRKDKLIIFSSDIEHEAWRNDGKESVSRRYR